MASAKPQLRKLSTACDLRDISAVAKAGQEIQFASRVISYSSQYDNQGWSAQKILGVPAVFPRYGDIRGAWAQGVCDQNQFIIIAFPKKLYIEALNIYETLNCGAISCIKVKTSSGQWMPVYNEQTSLVTEARIFTPDIQIPKFAVDEIRLELDCTGAGSWCEIDAVSMVGNESKCDPPPPLTDLSHHLYTLVDNPDHSDVCFDICQHIVHAHKAILAARSDYFQAMFSSGMKESRSKTQPILIKDVSHAAFMGLLQYFYTNTLSRDITSLTLLELIRVGDRFSASGLDQLCYWYLNEDINADNVVMVYRSAKEGLPILESISMLCLDYMADHMSSIACTEAFTILPQPLILEIVQHAAGKLTI